MNMQGLPSAGIVNKMERTLIEVIINCLLEIIRLGPQQLCRGHSTSIIFKTCFANGEWQNKGDREDNRNLPETTDGTPVYLILIDINYKLNFNVYFTH